MNKYNHITYTIYFYFFICAVIIAQSAPDDIKTPIGSLAFGASSLLIALCLAGGKTIFLKWRQKETDFWPDFRWMGVILMSLGLLVEYVKSA